MPFQAAPDIAQVTIHGSVDNQLTINDLYFFSSGGINLTNLATLEAAIATWVIGELAPLLSDDWTATKVRCVDLTTQTGPVVEVPVVATGGTAGEACPNNVAAVVSFRTAQRGRSARGRNFVPAVPGSLVTLNTLDAGWITDIITAYLSLVGAGTFVLGWQWVVLSRVFEGAPRAVGIGIPITSTLMTTNTVKSMRSREVGHGA
ncbi:MAG TPA: hypothetical protein VKB53_00360 [Gammaproteobacteria bacterium]|nr:hypothetical protein [Gammaproteobacteria bacterium]